MAAAEEIRPAQRDDVDVLAQYNIDMAKVFTYSAADSPRGLPITR